MTDEIRRRQKREELMAKAQQMQEEADRKRRLETIKLFIERRRSSKKPYSPEAGMALFRDLFRDTHHKATIGE